MDASLSTHWFSHQAVQAIGWTLVHSLWIGWLTALVAGGVLMATPKATSRVRYQLLSSTLLAFVLLMAFVLYRELTAMPLRPSTSDLRVESVGVEQAAFRKGNAIVNGFELPTSLVTFVNRESGWLVASWLFFFALKSLKLIGGFYYIHRIRCHRLLAVEPHWQARLTSFRLALGINSSVRLLQSALVRVPVTVGLIKPVILVPVGLFFQLSPEQVDTILWHELAHIRRRDYLVNILQCLLESVFFFNPGLLWLSSLIRDEREVCCDDIVLAHSPGKRHYVDALLAFQVNASPNSGLVMGLSSHQLVNRLKRMVTQENKRLSLVEKMALLAGLFIFSAFSLLPVSSAVTTPQRIGYPKQTSPGAEQAVSVNSKPTTRLILSPGGKRVKAVTDTVPIGAPQPLPPALVSRQFISLVFVGNNQDMANREMMARDVTGNRYHLNVVDSQLVALEINNTPVAQADLRQYQLLLRQIDQALMEKKQVKRDAIADHLPASGAERHRFWQQEALKKGSQAELALWQDTKKQGTAIKADTVAKTRSWKTKRLPEPYDLSFDQQRVRGVLAILVQQHIVPDASAVDGFGLSENELVVNGVRQPAQLHQQLKTQYGIKPDYGLYYGSGSGGKGVVLEKSEL